MGRGARRHRQPHRRGRATRSGAEAILPFCYGGSNGLLTQDSSRRALLPAPRRVAPGAHGVRRADRRGRTRRSTARCRRSPTRTIPHARLIVLWGVNPSASGIHLVPYVREAQRKRRDADRRRSAARRALAQAGRPAPRGPAGHRPAGRARHAPLPVRERASPTRRSSRDHATGVDELRARAAPWTFERAAAVAGIEPATLEQFARLYATASPALIRCGWGLERNRNGGNAAMAVLGAAGGRRQVRRARRRLLDEQLGRVAAEQPRLDRRRRAGDAPRQHEPCSARRCTDAARSADRGAVRLQRQPGRRRPRSERGHPRPRARGSLHRGLRAGDDRHGAATPTWCCRRPPSSSTTTSNRGYGGHAMLLVKPVIEPVGESRPNADVFSELEVRLGLSRRTDRGRDRGAAPRRAAPARRHRRGRARRRRRAAARRRPPDPVRRRAPAHRRPEGPPVPRRRADAGARRPLQLPARSRHRRITRWR